MGANLATFSLTVAVAVPDEVVVTVEVAVVVVVAVALPVVIWQLGRLLPPSLPLL